MARTLSAVGPLKIQALESEEPARRNARRSLVAARNIPAGTVISSEDLTWKRPAHGISPRYYDTILGMKARRDLPEDTVLRWGDVE